MSWALFDILSKSKENLKIHITKEKMTNKYKIWDERTAISPSGRHLRYFHALFKAFKFEYKFEKKSINEIREAIIDVHFIMTNIAAIHSHV